jgi:uncharacterized membrane protein YhaH (DUF805 family)
LVLWAPLPFGSVTPWGSAVVVVTICVGLVTALGGARRDAVLGPLVPALAALGALGLLGLTQSFTALSVAPGLSQRAAMGWFAIALLFALAGLIARAPGARPALLAAAAVTTCFQAVYGWRQAVRSPGEIWGIAVAGPGSRLRGTYVNADHLAILFEIMLAVAAAWAWWAWRRSRREPRFERRWLLLAPPWLLWLVCWASIFATGSRAALAAAVVGAVAQVALVFGVTRRVWIPILAVALVLAGVVTLLTLGPSARLGRQLSTPFYEIVNSHRLAVWEPAARIWRSAPVVGTGLGTFEEVFPAVAPPELTSRRWGRAHNDPLELLVTGGLVGLGLLLATIAILVRRLWAVYRRGAARADRATALAALAALVPVSVHELFDFGLTIPANAVLLTLLVGVAACAPTAEESEASPPPSRPALLPEA